MTEKQREKFKKDLIYQVNPILLDLDNPKYIIDLEKGTQEEVNLLEKSQRFIDCLPDRMKKPVTLTAKEYEQQLRNYEKRRKISRPV